LGKWGPNWRKDLDLWHQEQEAEWTTVGSKSHKSYADVVRNPPRLVFLRLNYPKKLPEEFFGTFPQISPGFWFSQFLGVLEACHRALEKSEVCSSLADQEGSGNLTGPHCSNTSRLI
jgi:hypothetical protein